MSVKKMELTTYEIEKFTGVNEFGMWHLKVKIPLVQEDCLEALKVVAAMDVALTGKNDYDRESPQRHPIEPW